jgi:Cu-Zn family superoxide dismutase
MRSRLLVALGLALWLAGRAVPVAAEAPDGVHVGDLWATAPIGASKNGAVFMTLHNLADRPVRLTGAASPAARKVELHRSEKADGVMRMRPVDAVEVPARGHAALRPGGYHVMLIGAAGIEVGDTVEITLSFDDAPARTVAAPVERAGTTPERVRRQVLVPIHRITAEGRAARAGTLALRRHADGLLAIPLLQGLQPGPHAMHVHTHGACGPGRDGADAKPGAAAGGHYDPDGSGRYAGPYRPGARGDMPNLTAEANGTATIPVLAPRLSLSDVRGRSVMIHASPDRYGPRLPGAAALTGRGDHAHGGTGGDHGHHGGMRMYCGVVPGA